MSRSFIERHSSDKITNFAYELVDAYTSTDLKNLYNAPDNVKIFPDFFDVDDDRYKSSIYLAHFHFDKKYPTNKPENLKKFQQAVLSDVCKYLTHNIRRELSSQHFPDKIRIQINNILRSIEKSNSIHDYENNSRCLQELYNYARYCAREWDPDDLNKEYFEEKLYPTVTARFPEFNREYKYPSGEELDHIDADMRIGLRIFQTEDGYNGWLEASDNSESKKKLFIIKEFPGEQKSICYIDLTGKEIPIEGVSQDEINRWFPTAGDGNTDRKALTAEALCKALGARFPRDRHLELAQRMRRKLGRGTTTAEYASAKLGALLEVPERLLRNYLLDNGFIGWMTDKNNDAIKTNRLRAREHQIPGAKNRTVKRLRARARQRQVTENYMYDKFIQGTSSNRTYNLDLTRKMFNAQAVNAGLISCKPCCLIVDSTESKNKRDSCNKAVTSDDHWLKELDRKNYPGNAYIVKQGVQPPTVFYVDRSGVVPVITELSIAVDVLFHMQYIAGEERLPRYRPGDPQDKKMDYYSPGEHVQRLRDNYARDAIRHSGSVREIQHMGRDLMSYMALCTGHIPTQQLPEEMEEKQQFKQACDNLQGLLDESRDLREQIIQFYDGSAKTVGKSVIQLQKDILPHPPDKNINYIYISSGSSICGKLHHYDEDTDSWVYTEFNEEEFSATEDFGSENISQDAYDSILAWVKNGKLGPCPVNLQIGACYSVRGKLNSKVWVSSREGVIVDVAPGGAGIDELNTWIKNHRTDIVAQGKVFGVRYVDILPEETLTQKQYIEVLIWRIQGRKGQCPVNLQVGTIYRLEDKPNVQVWVSESDVIVDCMDEPLEHERLDSWLNQNKKIIQQGTIDGLRFVEDPYAAHYSSSYLNSASQKQTIVTATKDDGEAQALRVGKTNIDETLQRKVQPILDKLRQIEDLPSSYITTSDSIVPYDTRQELVARLTECVRNPQGADTWDFFRDTYSLQVMITGEERIETYIKPENRCKFFYMNDKKALIYIDANLNAHAANLPVLPKEFREPGSYTLNSQQVFKHLTSKLPAESAFKVHTANEALEEIYADEVASTKSILKRVAQVALTVALLLLISSIPFVGQAFAVVGVSVATMWIGVVISCAVSSLFIARDISKHTLVSKARAELQSLRDEVRSFSDTHKDAVSQGDKLKQDSEPKIRGPGG